MDRRGAYFFVIDAFIASIIVIAAIVLISSKHSPAGPASQAFYTADDLMLVLETTHLNEIDNIHVRNWSLNGTVNDTSLSILQQLAYFNATGRNEHAQFLANVTIAAIPEQIGAELFILGTSYASNGIGQKDEAQVFFSSKRFVLVRNQSSELFPPVFIEVQTWQ